MCLLYQTILLCCLATFMSSEMGRKNKQIDSINFERGQQLSNLSRSFFKATIRLLAVSLFLENRWEECKTSEHASVAVRSLTYERRCRKL